MSISRRSFLGSASLLVVPAAAGAEEPIRTDYPAQAPELVQEMVGVSHGNIARVRQLLDSHPSLANAAWDWGFGDWENALGAASHVGNRDIAALLLAHGARPTIFSAAMLGQLDVVKAFVTASPGIQKIKGPHSITLMRHATAGGPASKPVVDYLTSIGGADERLTETPLTDAEVAKLAGMYSYGATTLHRIEISPFAPRKSVSFGRPGRSPHALVHLGSFEFYPVGAEAVRVRFAEAADGVTMTVHDAGVVMTAKKTPPAS